MRSSSLVVSICLALALRAGVAAEAQTITTVAGNGTNGFAGDGSAATAAALRNPDSVAVDAYGNVFIADTFNHRIRKVSPDGRIVTVAGNGTTVNNNSAAAIGDGGLATAASLFHPESILIDSAGNLLISDTLHVRVRKVDATTGIITTIAGTENPGFSGDGGPATDAQLNAPRKMTLDAAGNLFFADDLNHRVRRVDAATGTITTVAGNGSFTTNFPVDGGDGGLATNATLWEPRDVAVDAAGNLFIADSSNRRIRKVNAAGIITTVAGPESVFIPRGVGVDAAGNVFIADSDANVIRRMDAATGSIAVVAGTGFPGFSGDAGPATCALLNHPYDVAIDAVGNVFIADRLNNRIRKVGAVVSTGAGPDQSVDEGALVQLDGCGLELNVCDGPATRTYSWMQVAGVPSVTFSAADSCAATFIAPTVAAGGAVLTLQLTVTDGVNVKSDTLDVTVKNVNHAPVADAGDDRHVSEGTSVTLDGSNSFDPDGDALTFLWTQIGGTAVTLTDATIAKPSFAAPLLMSGSEVVIFRLTVGDGQLSSADGVEIVVENVNRAPSADAGLDASLSIDQLVTLDGSKSSDPDGNAGLTYLWTQIDGPAVTLTAAEQVVASFVGVEPGSYTFRLRVTDPDGAASADEVTIVVVRPNDPPTCELARPTMPYLWPPNHKMVDVGIAGVTDADGTPAAITIAAVRQDEPVDGLGDGDTSPDAVIQADTVLLRAERSGTGNGRYYHVGFRAEDAAGSQCTGTVKVFVPHDMRKPIGAVDDGPLFDSTRR